MQSTAASSGLDADRQGHGKSSLSLSILVGRPNCEDKLKTHTRTRYQEKNRFAYGSHQFCSMVALALSALRVSWNDLVLAWWIGKLRRGSESGEKQSRQRRPLVWLIWKPKWRHCCKKMPSCPCAQRCGVIHSLHSTAFGLVAR